VRPIVDIYAFDVEGSRGVYATIEGMQFAADGERISGGNPATIDDFAPLEGAKPAAGGTTAASVFD
jgi:hypothetical protein